MQKLYVNLNGTTEEKYQNMRRFVLDILKEKEAEYDAERRQGSYRLLNIFDVIKAMQIWDLVYGFACNMYLHGYEI